MIKIAYMIKMLCWITDKRQKNYIDEFGVEIGS